MRTVVLTLGLLLCSTVNAFAQAGTGACPTSTAVVTNPSWVCVTPGADYNATDPVSGAPRVTSLGLAWYLEGVDPATGSPVSSVNLGKPTMNAQGAVWAQPSQLLAIPVGQRFIPYATASNAAGVSGRSPAGNPFGRSNNSPPTAPAGVRLVP
jgi:hypothetical protein